MKDKTNKDDEREILLLDYGRNGILNTIVSKKLWGTERLEPEVKNEIEKTKTTMPPVFLNEYTPYNHTRVQTGELTTKIYLYHTLISFANALISVFIMIGSLDTFGGLGLKVRDYFTPLFTEFLIIYLLLIFLAFLVLRLRKINVLFKLAKKPFYNAYMWYLKYKITPITLPTKTNTIKNIIFYTIALIISFRFAFHYAGLPPAASTGYFEPSYYINVGVETIGQLSMLLVAIIVVYAGLFHRGVDALIKNYDEYKDRNEFLEEEDGDII